MFEAAEELRHRVGQMADSTRLRLERTLVAGVIAKKSREEPVDFGTNNMAKSNKFRVGQSGNPETMFKPGNRHRWQPGQSGNPSGIGRRRLK
jgi:hypothetical protein